MYLYGCGQNLKKGVGNKGVLHKIEGVRTPFPTMLNKLSNKLCVSIKKHKI